MELCYDPDWLIITKDTSGMFPNKPQRWVPPLVMDDHKYVSCHNDQLYSVIVWSTL